MTKLQEFTAFAGTKPANEKYNYMDCNGGCAVGQWMRATGVAWDINVYSALVQEMLGPHSEYRAVSAPLSQSETWGDLHDNLKVLVDA